MSTTIDELRAGWEQMREQVKALQLTAQFYAEQIQQQITEKERLIEENRELAYLRSRMSKLADQNEAKNELLWWVAAGAYQNLTYTFAPWTVVWDALKQVRQMLATQGYTRENLEKR